MRVCGCMFAPRTSCRPSWARCGASKPAPGFAGLFVWRFRAVFRPNNLAWAWNMDEVLSGR
jgi:hypothetical protein